MGRIITILLVLTLCCCKIASAQENVAIEEIEYQNSAGKIAVDFINSYVNYRNDQNSQLELIDYISQQQNLTQYFKAELEKIIIEAQKNDPELGLGFDPIIDAQDIPVQGFELDKFNEPSGLVTVKSKSTDHFKINIKMKRINEKWFVHGIGIINMSEKERVIR